MSLRPQSLPGYTYKDYEFVRGTRICRVLYCRGSLLFYGEVDAIDYDRILKLPRIIDIARLIPVYHTGMIRAENADPATKYVKRFDFLAKGERLFKKNNYSKMSSREIRMCEILMTDPHPNVCTYHGVTLDENGVISGLVFDKYQTTLWDLITQGVVFDTKKCMNDIQKGISHLHNNDMVHCDIKPENILAEKIEHGPLKGSYHFVVGDFDSTHFTGTKLTLKGGTHGWSLSRYTEAWPENDYYGLSMIRYWLEKKGWSREKVKPVAVDTTWILVNSVLDNGEKKEASDNREKMEASDSSEKMETCDNIEEEFVIIESAS